jgi:siroheme synthase
MPAVAAKDASLETQAVTRGTIASLPSQVAAAAPRGPLLVLIGPAVAEETDLAKTLAAADRRRATAGADDDGNVNFNLSG